MVVEDDEGGAVVEDDERVVVEDDEGGAEVEDDERVVVEDDEGGAVVEDDENEWLWSEGPVVCHMNNTAQTGEVADCLCNDKDCHNNKY